MNRAEALKLLGAGMFAGTRLPGSPAESPRAFGLNVRDFGAKGDGESDDTEAVQRAFAAAGMAAAPWNGGRLFFPAGVYVVGPLFAKAHCLSLFGEGWTNTKLKLKSQSNADLLTVLGGPNTNYTGVRIEAMLLDGNGAEQTEISHCLRISSVWNGLLGPGLGLTRAHTDGLVFSTDGGSGCVQNWCHGVYIEGCGRYGIHATEAFQQLNIVDSIVQWNKAGGICYEPEPGKMGGRISHNYFEGYRGHEQAYGIVVNANQYQSLEIHNNIFNGMERAAVWLKAGTRSVSLKCNQAGHTGGPHSVIIDTDSYGHVGELNDWDKPVSGMLPNTVAAGMSTDRGDADVTLQTLRDQPTQRFASPLSAARQVWLSPAYAFNGARFRIVRTGAGRFLCSSWARRSPGTSGSKWSTTARRGR